MSTLHFIKSSALYMVSVSSASGTYTENHQLLSKSWAGWTTSF